MNYPISVDNFYALCKIKSVIFMPSWGQEYSGQASGVIRAKDLRPPLWTAQITTVPLTISDSNDLQTILESLDGMTGTFLAYNTMRPYPKVARVPGGYTPKCNSIGSNGISLSVKGLPAGFIITKGDMIGWDYSTSAKALHRVQETVVANGSGITAEFEISPAIRPGLVTDANIALNKAAGEFMLSSTFTPSMIDSLTYQYSFNAIQVIS